MLKVLALTRYDRLGASSRVRFLQFLPHLADRQIQVSVNPLLDHRYLRALYGGQPINRRAVLRSYICRMIAMVRRRNYDLIWLEKEAFPWIPVWLEKPLLKGVPYVVDFDDAWFVRYDHHPVPALRLLLKEKMDVIMRGAAAVVAGNNYLAEYAQRVGAQRVELIPSTIDPSRYPPMSRIAADERAESRQIVIGWIGTPLTVHYLDQIEPALRVLLAEGIAKLHIVGAPVPPTLTNLPATSIAWSEATEISDICAFDVGIMPLDNDIWGQGKCAYKLLQMMAAGKPVVASAVGASNQVVRHEINGFLADTTEQWVATLRKLIADPELRDRVGIEARRDVERRYSLAANESKLVSVLTDAAKGDRS